MRRVLRKRHLSRVGLAGSSGRKVTVRPRSAPGEGHGALVLAGAGGWERGTPPPVTPLERQSPQRQPRTGPGGDEEAPLPPGQVA